MLFTRDIKQMSVDEMEFIIFESARIDELRSSPMPLEMQEINREHFAERLKDWATMTGL